MSLHLSFLPFHQAPNLAKAANSSTPLKILLVANTGWYLYNFRLPLARLLRTHGVEVVMVSPKDPYVSRLQAEGFRWIEYKLNRRSLNPLNELFALRHLTKIYIRECPAGVHHFTIKCVLYGTIAAKVSGVRSVVNAVTGLGHVFVGSKWKARIIRPIVKWIYKHILSARRARVIFQNPDDLKTFSDLDLVVPERTIIIRGSGVNLTKFAPRPSCPDSQPSKNVLFASRVIAEKGIYEYIETARILRSKGIKAVFQIAGTPDPGNPSSIPETELEQWQQEGVVDVLGHVDNMADLIAEATIVVLPSYREGTPRILLEAAAMGKPIVATDVPGCREAVNDGENGYLVPDHDAKALANAIERLLLDEALCSRMGKAGRLKMEREFDDQDVAERTLDVYRMAGLQSI